jgi:GMC oxidoreductase
MDAWRFGLIEYSVFDRIHVIHGSGVGGGSLHYFNVHVRPPASISMIRAGRRGSISSRWIRTTGSRTTCSTPLRSPRPTAAICLRARRSSVTRAGRPGREPELVSIAVYTARNGATRTVAANSGSVIIRAIAAWAARRVRRTRSISTTLRSPSGVVNDRGAVHGYPDLFVVDGSIVPTALSRNPTATISALAERADST